MSDDNEPQFKVVEKSQRLKKPSKKNTVETV